MELAIAVHGPQERLPIAPDTEEHLYLLVREAPANTVKRAHATAAAIDVTATAYAVAIQVGDNGRGFAPAHARAESFGLRSIHSRAAELGGRLEITSAPSRGTVVRGWCGAAAVVGSAHAAGGVRPEGVDRVGAILSETTTWPDNTIARVPPPIARPPSRSWPRSTSTRRWPSSAGIAGH